MIPEDTRDSILRPSWLAVAALVFARIDSPRRKAGAAELPAPGDLLAQTAALTEPADSSPDAQGDILDEISGSDTDGRWDTAHPRSLSPRLRLALLRLCAAFGDVSGLAVLARPSALTVIEGVPPDLFDEFSFLLRDDILPLAVSLQKRPKAMRGGSAAQPSLVSPSMVSGEVSDTARKRFDAGVIAVLESPVPSVFLLPFGMSPTKLLLDCAPVRFVLPALDRAMLMRYWSGTEPRLTKLHAALIAGLLPDDDRIAELGDAALLSALRMSDPRDAAKAISARCTKPSGPRLGDLPDTAAKRAATDLIAGLQAWRDGTATWDEVSHSLLLYGPAGTGKSYIAQAMASVPGIRFIRGSFAEWQACGHLGDMLKAMHTTFAQAQAAAPAVLFIDEIDSAGSRFSDERHNKGYMRQVINAFLLAIDQLNAAGGVLLVGACNDPAAMDPAILRPGRFDRHVEVPLPDRNALAAVLRTGLGDALTTADIGTLTRRVIGNSMAAVDSIIRAAKSSARSAGRPIALADVKAALPPVQSSPALEWRVAVHEAGHAVVAHAFAPGSVTRISVGNAGGKTERVMPLSELLESDFTGQLAVLMAGRAAERLVLGTVSGGAGGSEHSDLAQVTAMATAMEKQLGFGSMGPVWFAPASPSDPHLVQRVRARLEGAEADATRILTERKPGLIAVAKVLLAEREVSGSRLDDLLTAPDIQETDPPSHHPQFAE